MDEPYQFLARFARDMLQRARIWAASEWRAEIRGLREVDVQITTAILKDLDTDDAGLFRCILAAGSWGGNALAKIGPALSDACRFCGAPRGGVGHRGFSRPRFDHIRMADPLLSCLDHRALPVSLLECGGVPPPLYARPDGDFWGGQYQAAFVDGGGTAMVVRHGVVCVRPSGIPCSDELGWTTYRYARQVVPRARVDPPPPPVPLPAVVVDPSPASPSAFTDATVTTRMALPFALGGIGVRIPGCGACQDGEIALDSEYLRELVAADEGAGGALRPWAPVGGRYLDSTRAELQALVTAACAAGPLHLGSDSLTRQVREVA